MTIKLGTKFLARAVGAAALLGVALVAGGVVTSPKITLSDSSGKTLECALDGTVSGPDTNGDVTALVAPGCLGFSTLTVTKSGTGASIGSVTSSGINCGTDCSEPYSNGTPVTLTATAPTGSTFTGWAGGTLTCNTSYVSPSGNGGTCDLTVAASGTIVASFTAPPTLTVVKAGTGSGTITGTGISCGTSGTGDCTELYGSSILLTATLGSGSTFAGWSGGGCSGTGTTCTPALTVSGTVTATFNGSCSTPPATGRVVSIVETGTITGNWAQRTFSPLPSTITAFHVNVPSGFGRRDDIVAIKGSTSARAPMMILSTQPGCADPFPGQAACKISALDGAKVKMSGNPADTIYYCKLPPGDYYVNAFNQATVGGAYTCTNTTNCTFYASRSANY